MKMPEKHDPVGRHSRRRNRASGQSLRLQWRTFMTDIMAVRFKNDNRRNDVRHYQHSSFVTFSTTCRTVAIAY